MCVPIPLRCLRPSILRQIQTLIPRRPGIPFGPVCRRAVRPRRPETHTDVRDLFRCGVGVRKTCDAPWDRSAPGGCMCGGGMPCPTCDPAVADHPPRPPANFTPDDD